jgi:hypothetical protein
VKEGSNGRDYPFKLGFNIGDNVRVGIFVYSQSGSSVRDKNKAQAGGNTALVDNRTNLGGNIYKFGLAVAGCFKTVQGQDISHA